jgi:Protein of unknown function DUF262/Protein of unknown function (DUF1524)
MIKDRHFLKAPHSNLLGSKVQSMSGVPLSTHVLTVEALFRLGIYAPAAVQRDYQWRSPQVRALLNDLDRTFSASSLVDRPPDDEPAAHATEAEPDRIDTDLGAALNSDAPGDAPAKLDHYMLGAIVVTPAVGGQRQVYDGLQRLTTLTILMAVLRDLCDASELQERLDGLIRFDERQFRVVLAGRDSTLARQIQPRGEAIKARRTEAPSDMAGRIRVAAQVFRESIKPWSASRRLAFTHFLLERVFIDLVEARDPRLARQIFVTTNMRGKNLNRVDLLKGQLVDIADNEATATAIVAHWNGARNASGDQFERLLVAVDFIERQSPQGDDCLNALAEYVKEKRGPAGIEAWIQRLTMFAGDLLELDDHMQRPPTDVFTANIWRLQLFRWDQWRPLALLWLADYRRAKKQGGPGAKQKIEAAERRFAALHKRCMGISLCGFSAADRERIFARAISQTSRGINPLSSSGALAFPQVQINRIAETLRLPLTDKDVRSMLIRWAESVSYEAEIPMFVREATVEHILPRRIAVTSDWAKTFPDVDERYLACNALGNLSGLDKSRNEKLKNADFTDKARVFAEAQKDYHTLRDVRLNEPWTAVSIAERTRQFAAHIESALDLPAAYSNTAPRSTRA